MRRGIWSVGRLDGWMSRYVGMYVYVCWGGGRGGEGGRLIKMSKVGR